MQLFLHTSPLRLGRMGSKNKLYGKSIDQLMHLQGSHTGAAQSPHRTANRLRGNQASALINKYGDTLTGMFGMTSVATPATAEAVKQANLCGKVAIVGLATPNAMKPYVTSDCVKSVVLWNPVDLGYAAVYAMRATIDGKLKPGATELDAGHLGKLKIVNGSEILLGAPFVFTKDNIAGFDF